MDEAAFRFQQIVEALLFIEGFIEDRRTPYRNTDHELQIDLFSILCRWIQR